MGITGGRDIMRLFIENEKLKKEYMQPTYEIDRFSIQNILTFSGSQDDNGEDDEDYIGDGENTDADGAHIF